MAAKRRSQSRRIAPATAGPPARVAEIAKELRSMEGVRCVVWGARCTGGRWFRKPCLSVHVKKKLPKARLGKRLLPKSIDGIRIDVIEVAARIYRRTAAPRPSSR